MIFKAVIDACQTPIDIDKTLEMINSCDGSVETRSIIIYH
jgi:hypothetical protein